MNGFMEGSTGLEVWQLFNQDPHIEKIAKRSHGVGMWTYRLGLRRQHSGFSGLEGFESCCRPILGSARQVSTPESKEMVLVPLVQQGFKGAPTQSYCKMDTINPPDKKATDSDGVCIGVPFAISNARNNCKALPIGPSLQLSRSLNRLKYVTYKPKTAEYAPPLPWQQLHFCFAEASDKVLLRRRHPQSAKRRRQLQMRIYRV